jgi:arylsulfatase A-like enzyme
VLFWRQGEKTALRMGDWKIVYHPGRQEWELYNLAADLAESDDLTHRFPEKAEALIQEWEALNGQMMKPFF